MNKPTELQKRLRIGGPELESQPPEPGQFWRLDYRPTDGGRKLAGYKGDVSDCVVRAAAIVDSIQNEAWPDEAYQKAYDRITELNKQVFDRKRKTRRKSAPRPYDYTYKKATRELMEERGGDWTPTMEIGGGCQVHMRADELPSGLLVVSVSKHVTVVCDHVILDTHNPDRKGNRCVYGYWKFKN